MSWQCSPPRWWLLSLFISFIIAQQVNAHVLEAFSDTKPCGLRPSEHVFIFYCLRPSNDFLDFAVELSLNSLYDVYVVPDDETYVWADEAKYPSVHWTIIPKSTVLAANFSHASNLFPYDKPRNESVWAMDRALTLAASDEFTEKYCRIWLIEDDVFIPSVAAALHVDKLASGDYDFISTPKIFPYKGDIKEYHWQQFKDSLHQVSIPTKLWGHCMANSVGLSPRFLKMLRAFAAINGQLLWSEPMFPTFVAIWKLRHLRLEELHMNWRNKGEMNYSWKQVSEHGLWWYHPMKDEQLRKEYREQLKIQNSSRRNEPTLVPTEEDDDGAFDWHAKLKEVNLDLPIASWGPNRAPLRRPRRPMPGPH